MWNADISSAYETFLSVEKLAPMAKFARGHANIEMEYHSLMDNTFTPLYESIDAKGHAYTKGLQFYNLDEFIPLSDVLKNEKFTEMAPDEVKVGFTVLKGRIIFDPFDMDVYDSRITVSGSHGLDRTMDYKMDMNIAKSDLGAGANDLIQGMTLLAAGAGIKIPQSDYIKVMARLGGTFNHPKITTDLSGNLKSGGETVQATVEERVTQEVKKVEEKVRNEASVEAEKLIAGAEAEAARLVEEARKTGEVLVKEAEAQGEKLLEEAGSNPLKQVAARTAASELKRQAEKQSVNLVNEAEKKGAEIIQKARDEADKI
jgi:vacuolar-type H+-ATPase subunit H